MSELKKRNVLTAEFKAKVGLEAVRGLKTINEISQMYGVHPTSPDEAAPAIYLVTQSKTKISALALRCQVGISWRDAWPCQG
jgi:hypothetical protein